MISNRSTVGDASGGSIKQRTARRGALTSIGGGANGDGDTPSAEEVMEAVAGLEEGLAPYATLVRRIFQYYSHFGQVREWGGGRRV